MAYYSNVAIAIKKDDYKKMLKAVEEKDCDLKIKEKIEEFVKLATQDVPDCYNDENYMFLYWEDEKWYDEFAEVKFVMDFLKTIKDFDFIKIGEDFDDVKEIMQTGKYLLRPIRTIQFR